MAKKHKQNPAAVNSSFTVFFLLASVITSFVFSKILADLQGRTLIVLLLFALLQYVVWDLIKQLYSPGQSVILYAVTYLIMPVTLNTMFGYPYGRVGYVVLLGSYVLAIICELIHEAVVKQRMPKRLIGRLLMIDDNIDKSFIQLHANHLLLTEYRGLLFGLFVNVVYISLTYVLLHSAK